MSNLFKWAGILWVASTVLSKTASNTVLIGKTNFRVLSSNLAGMQIEIDVPVINKLPVAATVNSINTAISYGPQMLANVVLPQPVLIEANKTTLLQLTTYISIADLAGDILDLIFGGNYLSGIKIKGIASIADINIPIDQPIHPI